jgi:hypothetical protein
MLAAGVWVGAVEVEASDDLAVHRPAPRARRGDGERERAQDQDAESSHVVPPSLSELRTTAKVASGGVVVNTGYKVRR